MRSGLRAGLEDVSVIVPVGPGDEAWRGLLAELEEARGLGEIILVGTEPRADPRGARWLLAPRGRPTQLNAGARAATRPILWFLHADSRLTESTLPSLALAIRTDPAALHYFDLRFLDDGPRWMRITEAGVRFRSRILGLPFGDQGFCLSRDVWERVGGFPPAAAYGEDHLLVWGARQAGVRVRPTGGTILTSARRYRDQGWLATTTRHLTLTARQAFPEWKKWIRTRLAR